MACGLAILVAGGSFLWRIVAHRDELTVPEIRTPGQSQQVGNVTATVAGSTDVGSLVVVRVHIQSGQRLTDAGQGWSLVVTGDTRARAPVSVPADQGPACAGVAVEPGPGVDCSLAFPAGDGDRYVAFAVGGTQRQWRL